MLQNYRAIGKNRPFMWLWSGSLVSAFGDRFTEFGLAWYVLGRTQNPLDVGLTFLVFELPGLFSGLLVGWFLDHFRREAVMLIDSVVRGLLVLLIPVLDNTGLLSLPLLYLLIALMGSLAVITRVGSRTLITDYVSPDHYNTANSLDTIQAQFSAIVAPSLAGILIAVIGPLALLWLDSFSFFCFALILFYLWRLQRPSLHGTPPESPASPASFWRQLSEGFNFTFRSPVLIALISISFCWNFGLGIYQVALPFYCNDTLGVGAAGMGLIVAVNAAGALLSALIFGPLQPRYPGRLTCLLLVAQAICYFLLGAWPIFWLVLLLSATVGAFDDVAAVYLTTVRQRATPPILMGRVLAFSATLGPLGLPLGSGLAGFLVAGFGPPLIVAAAGLPLLSIAGLCLAIGPLRNLQGKA